MDISINFVLEDYNHTDMPADVGYDEGQRDPQDLLLTPQELGDAIVTSLKALDAKGQLMDPVVRLPYYNDDAEDIAVVIQRGMSDTKHIVHFEFTNEHGTVIERYSDARLMRR